MVLEKTLESPLDCQEIQPVHPEGDQPWDFFGGNDAMYGCESWTVKKAEHGRIDAFELWCWRRLLTNQGPGGPRMEVRGLPPMFSSSRK